MSAPSGSVYWPTIPPPKPVDAQRRVVTDETGRPVSRASDPRVRWWEQRWLDPFGTSRRRRFSDKREAERFHEDLRAAKRDGWPACPKDGRPLSPKEQREREVAATLDVDRLVKEFLAACRGEWSPKTFQTYEPALRLAARWLREDGEGTYPPVAAVSRRDIERLLKRRRHTRLVVDASHPEGAYEHVDRDHTIVSAATLKNFKKALGFLFRYAEEQEHLIGPNPMNGIRLKNLTQRKVVVTPTLDELEQLFAYLGDLLGVIALLRGTTALRPQEVRGLRIRDVDTASGWLHVQDTRTTVASRYNPDGSSTVEGGLKHRARGQIRSVPVLHPWVEAWLAERVAAAERPEDRVFYGPRGGPVNTDNLVRRYFKPAVRRLWGGSPLEDLTFYQLRHTAHGVWRELGVPVETAAEWAGHHVDVMHRHYSTTQHGEHKRVQQQALEHLHVRMLHRRGEGDR